MAYGLEVTLKKKFFDLSISSLFSSTSMTLENY